MIKGTCILDNLTLRPATERDLSHIIGLFVADELGSTREALTDPLPQSYHVAFEEIAEDKNQALFRNFLNSAMDYSKLILEDYGISSSFTSQKDEHRKKAQFL